MQARPDHVACDVATGTGAVALELVRAYGCGVVAVDQSPEMLATARERLRDAGLGERVRLVEAGADDLPFEDGAFDDLTFTYLLRYVDDPAATLRELARVVRSGGVVAALEFGVPRGPARLVWEAYVRAGLPLAGRALAPGWAEVGDFLGASIRDFYRGLPLDRQLALWQAAGFRDVRVRRLTFGAAVVIWGRRA